MTPNSRSYLNRFLSPDPIIQDPYNPIDWDRYAYGNNNPVKYNDPSGHIACSSIDDNYRNCGDPSLNQLGQRLGIKFAGSWTNRNKVVAIVAGMDVGEKFASQVIGSGGSESAFKQVFKNGITLTWGKSGAQAYCYPFEGGGCTNSATSINFMSLANETISLGGTRTEGDAFIDAVHNVVHEFGHAFASLWYHNGVYSPDGPYGAGQIPDSLRKNEQGFVILDPPNKLRWRQHPGDTGPGEIFADMFLGWTYGVWNMDDGVGLDRDIFMVTNMVEWVSKAAQ